LFGVKAFELVANGDFGKMVSFKNNDFIAVPLEEATKENNFVRKDSFIVQGAKGLGITFGD
jgi:6-phosphofructokinase 1